MSSGKRHACGFNIQGVGSHHGTLVLTGASIASHPGTPPAYPIPPPCRSVAEWLDRTLPADVFDVLLQVAAHHRSTQL